MTNSVDRDLTSSLIGVHTVYLNLSVQTLRIILAPLHFLESLLDFSNVVTASKPASEIKESYTSHTRYLSDQQLTRGPLAL